MAKFKIMSHWNGWDNKENQLNQVVELDEEQQIHLKENDVKFVPADEAGNEQHLESGESGS